MNRLSALAAVLIVAAFACGKLAPLPAKPQLIVDRDSLGFGLEFGSATYVGTQPQNALLLSNQGTADLVISSTVLDGGGAFTIEGPVKTTLKSKENTFIRVIFTPTAETNYAGSITLTSNAENFPTKTIGLSGAGLYCQKLSTSNDAGGCRVEFYCADGGQPVVNCGPNDAGVINCTCFFNGDSGTLNRPDLCTLPVAARIAATRSVCGWSL